MIYTHTLLIIHMHIHMYIHTYIHIHIYVYIHTYTHKFTHIHTYLTNHFPRRTKRSHQQLIDPLAGSAARMLREGRPLTVAQKHAIASHMKALRETILGSADSSRDSSLSKLGERVDCSFPYPAVACRRHAHSKKERDALRGRVQKTPY